MIVLTATTDKIQCITSAAATIDVHASWVDHTITTDNVEAGRTNTAITTAATTDIVPVPGANITKNVKTITVRNKHASLATDITIQFNQNATLFELFKVTLLAGQTLEFVEGVGFFVVAPTTKLYRNLRVSSDVTNATTSFADITGLTQAVESGKHYNFEAQLYHINNATTTGSQFAINGPTMTSMRLSAISTVTGSATAAVMSAPVGDITTRDAAIVVQTTGPANVVMSILSGWINPSAAGTFAVRLASEVAVASGIIVKAGSWCQIWEADN